MSANSRPVLQRRRDSACPPTPGRATLATARTMSSHRRPVTPHPAAAAVPHEPPQRPETWQPHAGGGLTGRRDQAPIPPAAWAGARGDDEWRREWNRDGADSWTPLQRALARAAAQHKADHQAPHHFGPPVSTDYASGTVPERLRATVDPKELVQHASPPVSEHAWNDEVLLSDRGRHTFDEPELVPVDYGVANLPLPKQARRRPGRDKDGRPLSVRVKGASDGPPGREAATTTAVKSDDPPERASAATQYARAQRLAPHPYEPIPADLKRRDSRNDETDPEPPLARAASTDLDDSGSLYSPCSSIILHPGRNRVGGHARPPAPAAPPPPSSSTAPSSPPEREENAPSTKRRRSSSPRSPPQRPPPRKVTKTHATAHATRTNRGGGGGGDGDGDGGPSSPSACGPPRNARYGAGRKPIPPEIAQLVARIKAAKRRDEYPQRTSLRPLQAFDSRYGFLKKTSVLWREWYGDTRLFDERWWRFLVSTGSGRLSS